MGFKHFKNSSEKSDKTARELLRFTTERLPRYEWFARGLAMEDQKPDFTGKDRT